MATAQDLSIRQLQYVVAVAETLGFHRAAERCHVSQPTLSAQIKELEEQLGVRIFERDRKRVLVTPRGAALVAHAKSVLVAVADLLSAAAASQDPFAGTLRVGVIPTVAPYLLPEISPALAARWPNLRLAFREEKTADVVAHLEEGGLDAGLIALVPEVESSDFAHVVVSDDRFVAALPKDHPLAKRKRLSLADLEDESVLLLDDGHCLRTQALALCAKAGARETDLRATSLATLVQMVASGAGITLLPELAVPVENRRAQLEIRPFASPVPKRTLALVWRRASPQGDALREIAAAMTKALGASSR